MDMKIVGITVAVLVSITVLAGVLMPVLDDATATTDTFSNVGYFDMTYTEEESITAVWDHTDPNSITINGTDITLPTTDQFLPKTILCGDDWLIRYSNGGQSIGFFVQYYGPSGSSILASESDAVDMTITCSSNAYSIVTTHSTPKTASGTYTYLYCVSNDGDYVMKNSTDKAYVNGDTSILAMGISNVGNVPSVGISIEGTIDDGFTWVAFRGTGISFSNEDATYSEVSDHKNLYSIDKLTATASDGGSNTANLTYNYFIVPAEVTAERSVHFTDNQNALFAVIPMLVIVAILIGVVALVIRSRLD